MKLLFIDSSRNGWGTETHFVELVTAVHQAGHDVRAVVRRNSPVDQLLRGSPIARIATPFRGGADPRALATIVRVIKRDRPDWIITSRGKLYWPALVLGLAFDVRVALFRHLAYLKHWPEQRLVPRLADRFYVVSQFAQDVLVEGGAPRERLTPLYNPIDMQRFRPPAPAERAALRERLGFQAGDLVAGFAGRMETGKGVVPLCEAAAALMKRHPTLRMLWIGDGPERATLERFAAATGGQSRHVFVGWQPRVEEYFGALDVLVAPSIVPETFGRVVAEAQACGVAVIASGAGGLSEAFQPDRTGLLLDQVDTTAICEAIEKLITTPHLRQWLSTHGREFVQARFAADKVAHAFVAHLAATPLPAAFDLPQPTMITAVARAGTQHAHTYRDLPALSSLVADTPVELQPG